MVGEMFGGYRVLAKLGTGGMGEVFLAAHQRIERRAAIKVLIPELTQNPDIVRRFLTEARATSLIRHPGIVEVFDCDVHPNGRAYIVMEYLEGETLADRLERERKLPWTTACLIAEQAAEALAAVHDRAIAHRDLKPDNLFLVSPSIPSRGPAVKVLDFGIAKLFADEWAPGSRTRTGALLGTPTYMSPEQCGGRPDVDHRADIYALGCILFEMIVGLPPFSSARRMRELLLAHMFTPAPSLGAEQAGIPGWLDGLVARMLAKDPDARPPSMAEVASTLGQVENDDARATIASSRVHRPRRRVRINIRYAAAAAILLGTGGVFGSRIHFARSSSPATSAIDPELRKAVGAAAPESSAARASESPLARPETVSTATTLLFPLTAIGTDSRSDGAEAQARPAPVRARVPLRHAASVPVTPLPTKSDPPPPTRSAIDTDAIVDL